MSEKTQAETDAAVPDAKAVEPDAPAAVAP